MKSATVLLVDDEDELRRSAAQSLDLAGFSVRDFAGAERALDFITQGFNGVVVTDIRMPGMDGMTLMARIRDIDPDIPVILATGHGDVQLAVRAMAKAPTTLSKNRSPASTWPTWRRARSTGAGWCSKIASSGPWPASATTSRPACPAAPRR
jgi:DNA-binding NtrC family response regulator